VSEDGAAERFWLQLHELYQEAGRPTLQRFVHLGQQQLQPISISASTINDWLNSQAIPTGANLRDPGASNAAVRQVSDKSLLSAQPCVG
jgi:hypothetical protein